MKCLSNKVITNNILNDGIILFINDYDDFRYDYPNINNILINLLKSLKDNNYISNDFYNKFKVKLEKN